MERFLKHGFEVLVFFFPWLFLTYKPKVLIKKGSSGKTTIFISGYMQPVTSWFDDPVAKRIIEESKDTLIFIMRRGEDRHGQPWYKQLWFIGIMPLFLQLWEVKAIFKNLLKKNLMPHEKEGVRIIGHSQGAVTAKYLAAKFPKVVGNIFAPCQVTENRASILRNPAYWRSGGWLTLPKALMVVLIPFCGLILPPDATKGLFCGHDCSEEQFRKYQSSLIRESVLSFLAFLVWFKDTSLEKAIARGWNHKCYMLWSFGDWLYQNPKNPEPEELAKKYGDHFKGVELHGDTPHCYWNARKEVLEHNSRIFDRELKEAGII